jgi:mRNA interferase MazF
MRDVTTNPPARGGVYWADLGNGRKPWVVLSNNRRNRALPSVLVARVTTMPTQAGLPTWVPLTDNDPLTGFVITDDVEHVRKQCLDEYLGTLSPETVAAVNDALRVTFALA